MFLSFERETSKEYLKYKSESKNESNETRRRDENLIIKYI